MTSVCLVGKDCIVKEGLKGILSRTDFQLAGDFEDAESLAERNNGSNPANLIINIDTGGREAANDLIDTVRRQKTSYPESRVVILSGCSDVPVVAAAFSTGADGYLMKDISTDGLMGSLKMVLSGEKVFPTSVLNAANNPSPQSGPAAATARAPLSERETGIIRHLAAGDSNKAIALSLHIREATVKTHVKKILKKLGVANRTQAAVWAIAHGLDTRAERASAE